MKFSFMLSFLLRVLKPIVAPSVITGLCFGLSTQVSVWAQESPRGPGESSSVRVVERFDPGKARFVHGPRGMVKSGPFDDAYGTATLPSGARVEVYLETSNGWSGIRPPEGSHNWIPAQSAFLLPGGKTAEVVEENTAAWIGSADPILNAWKWQTALCKSQVVQVLGEQSQSSADGTTSLWYRIAPPQGEFRWIRTSQLSDSPSDLSEQTDAPKLAAKYGAASHVSLASHVASAEANTAGTNVKQASAERIVQGVGDGQMVWSDEAEAIAEAERLIREEQSIAMQGAPDGSLLASDEMGPEPLESVQASMTPQELAKAKRHRAAQHQVDSLKHWDALQSTDPKLRIKPLASVLGLVGFGIVEADRKPVRSQIAAEHHQFRRDELRYDSRLDSVGPSGYGRLDRLPRPGRGPRVRAPLGSEMNDSISEIDRFDGESPHDESKPILTRLWTAEQPLFGGGQESLPIQNRGEQWGPRDHIAGENATRFNSGSEWHGIVPRGDTSGLHLDRSVVSQDIAEAEFDTPEVQSAMLELSRIVSQPTERWELDRLRRQCEDWIERGDSAIVRGEARLLMERVDRFDSLRNRMLGSMVDPSRVADSARSREGFSPSTAASLSSTTPSMFPPSSISPSPVQFAGHSVSRSGGGDTSIASVATATNTVGAGAAGAGDASGWLVQVHGSLPGQPEYALTDDLGSVVTYVQSTAALNLRRYLQQPVVIRGQRGYIPSLAARQIVAESISRLR